MSNIIPLGNNTQEAGGLVSIENNRAIQEVQASLIIAKRFPRDEVAAEDKIIKACTNERLADLAIYEYPRGGQTVTGPSIRLAEVLKRYWGNMESGWRELERRGDISTLQAYAWDKETNVREERIFTVKQQRDKWSKVNGKSVKTHEPLSDERDIYENNANQAARRMRACILALIPGDIIDIAVKQCETTLATRENVTEDSIAKLAAVFEKDFKVTKDMLQEYLGRNLTADAVSPAMMVKLRGIYKSIKDGVGKVEDFFEVPVAEPKKEEIKPGLEGFKEKHKETPKEEAAQGNLLNTTQNKGA